MDKDFSRFEAGLRLGVDLSQEEVSGPALQSLPETLPEFGLGSEQALRFMAPLVLGGAISLGDRLAMAHMDPPTPWITWVTSLWNASINQNLLHPATSPAARQIEERVIGWISPMFGMNGGHMTPGSTVSNLTALWAARELKKIRAVVASSAAHLSIRKSANILGLEYIPVDPGQDGRLTARELPHDLSDKALVLTAGTTSTGVIDELALAGNAAWTHVDAAWAGPLIFTKYGALLSGVSNADSVAMSAHKLMFQPKESALVLFRDVETANKAISYGGAYLAAPNIGVLGSRGASGVNLLTLLLAWGREGLASRVERCIENAKYLEGVLRQRSDTVLFGSSVSGVVVWRPARQQTTVQMVQSMLPPGSCSTVSLGGTPWVRHVAGNPNLDLQALALAIDSALGRQSRTA